MVLQQDQLKCHKSANRIKVSMSRMPSSYLILSSPLFGIRDERWPVGQSWQATWAAGPCNCPLQPRTRSSNRTTEDNHTVSFGISLFPLFSNTSYVKPSTGNGSHAEQVRAPRSASRSRRHLAWGAVPIIRQDTFVRKGRCADLHTKLSAFFYILGKIDSSQLSRPARSSEGIEISPGAPGRG